MKKNFLKYGSDFIVDILKKNQIEYVSFNPGASFKGLHDSLINDPAKKKIETITCLHEEISVAFAHGYIKASGKLMAVLIHANVGLQHASMAIFNAWCDRIPMLLIGANGPVNISKRRPWIDWIHTTNNQPSIIKDYVKWFDTPQGADSLKDALYRGIKISKTDPQAPTYIEIDADFQETVIKNPPSLDSIVRYKPPNPPSGNFDDINKIVLLLQKARFPIIAADYLGRNPEAIDFLVKIAEYLKIPVWDCGGRFNFPTKHYLNITGKDKTVFRNCDFLLALDVKDLYGTIGHFNRNNQYQTLLKSSAKIAHITMFDYLVSKWAADYQKLVPIDIHVAANTVAALPQIYNLLIRKKLNYQQKLVIKSRQNQIIKLNKNYKYQLNQIIKTSKNKSYLNLPITIKQIWESIKKYDWVLTNNGNSPINNWIRKIWDINSPNCYFGGSAGVGLGYGLGASIGIAFAKKNKLCIDIQPDGDFLYTPQALWTAVNKNIPLLIIVMNNRSYYNSENHAKKIAKIRSHHSPDTKTGIRIEKPNVIFSKLAASFGAIGLGPVTNIKKLKKYLDTAISFVLNEKKVVVVDVILKND